MKTFVFTLFLFFCMTQLHAVTPFRFIVNDGGAHVEFATATVNDLAVFSGDELSGVEKLERMKGRGASIKNHTPTATEIAISTCVLKFDNGSDFANCLTNKDALKRKIRDLKAEINIADPADIEALQARLDYLKSYKQSLP